MGDKKKLKKCLISLQYQRTKVNVILVSPTLDVKTMAILYGCKFFIEPESNTKGSHRAVACNEGLRHSKSEFVGFLDDDVDIPSDWSKDMIKYLKGNFRIGAVTSGCTTPKSGLGYYCHLVQKIGSKHAHSFKEIVKVQSVPGYNAVYRRSAIDQVGGFDESIGGCEDWELNLRLRKASWHLIGVPSSPVEHRQDYTILSFIKQMFGYGWSRARLCKVKRIFTPLHIIPTVTLALLSVLALLSSPLFTQFLLLISSGLLLLSAILNRNHLNLRNVAWTFLMFVVMYTAWALGYVKGLEPFKTSKKR